MQQKCYFVPRIINQQFVYMWKQDEVPFLIMPWLFAFVPGGYLGFSMSLITLILALRMLKHLSIDKPNGYMLHWIRFNLPKAFLRVAFSVFGKNMKSLDAEASLFKRAEAFPPAHIRHIAG
jgi:hypothetical protein